MKHLYFVRHGLSVMNLNVVFSGRTDTPLAPEGVEQCRIAGEQLRTAGIDCIVSSPIARALSSAEIIAEVIGFNPANIIQNELLIERDFGPLEGTPYTTNINLDAIDGVEKSSDLLARVKQAYIFLQGLEANTILVVSHGAVGRALRSLAQPDTPFEGSQHFDNAQVEQLL